MSKGDLFVGISKRRLSELVILQLLFELRIVEFVLSNVRHFNLRHFEFEVNDIGNFNLRSFIFEIGDIRDLDFCRFVLEVGNIGNVDFRSFKLVFRDVDIWNIDVAECIGDLQKYYLLLENAQQFNFTRTGSVRDFLFQKIQNIL